MSHFSTCKTILKRKTALIKALQRVDGGKWKNAVEVTEKPTNLYGYHGDRREQTAEIIIRRKDIGSASNDIGFKLQEDGTFSAIISAYDSRTYDKDWLDSLCQTYASETVKEVAEEQGFSFEEEMIDGQLHITCERAY